MDQFKTEVVKTDFTVVGAGLSGMAAAIIAARKGLAVALINDRAVPGGNASSEINVDIEGASHNGLNPAVYAKEGGFVEELRQKLYDAYENGGYGDFACKDAVFFDLIYDEPNIRLFLNTIVNGVEMDGKRIRSVSAFNPRSERHFCFESPLFADCTGDGTVANLAGAEYHVGREARAEFGEKNAPEVADFATMGNTLYFELEDVGHPVPFHRPHFAHDITKLPFFQDLDKPENFRALQVSGKLWTLEFGGHLDIIQDSEDIALELRRLVFGIWDYLKNSGRYPQAANLKLKRVYTMPGIRESRRFIGDYVLTENDIAEHRTFEDGVAIGGWPIDLHPPKGIYDPEPASNFAKVSGLYQIPFRCLCSKDVENLMLAGRNISVTHVALGSTRVMGTCGAVGQAVGAAASLCKKYGINPRGVWQEHTDELRRELVVDDQSITGACDSPNPSLERLFTAEASSELCYENTAQAGALLLDDDYGLALPMPGGYLQSVCVKVQNHTDSCQTLTVDILTGHWADTYLPEKREKSVEIAVPAGFCGWMEVQADQTHGGDGKIYLVFRKNLAVSLFYSEETAPGAITHLYYSDPTDARNNHDSGLLSYEKTGYTGLDRIRDRQILFKNVLPQEPVFGAQNLLNGFSRPYGQINQWVSAAGLQQQVVLTAKAPQLVREIHLVWDTELDGYTPYRIGPRVVRDYDVTVQTKTGSQTYSVRGNVLRLNKLRVEAQDVEKITVDIYRTNGSSRVAMYAIKLI